jgi:catechol 2,3-dioxygenase-like lactoylglutathione lyase family enzyme
VAFVVRDADATMKHWAEVLGVGPFLVRREVSFEQFRYRGEPGPSPVITLGLAHSGPLQIEVIQQHNDAPSAYLDYLAAGGNGMQHAGAWYADRASYQAAYDRLVAQGLECAHEGLARGVDVRFAYFRSPGDPAGVQIEIAEALAPAVAGRIALMEKLAAEWDGSDPIREGGFAPAKS